MSDQSQGPGWWQASDGKWYAPELHPSYVPPAPIAGPPGITPPLPPIATQVTPVVTRASPTASAQPPEEVVIGPTHLSSPSVPRRWWVWALPVIAGGLALAILLPLTMGGTSKTTSTTTPRASAGTTGLTGSYVGTPPGPAPLYLTLVQSGTSLAGTFTGVSTTSKPPLRLTTTSAKVTGTVKGARLTLVVRFDGQQESLTGSFLGASLTLDSQGVKVVFKPGTMVQFDALVARDRNRILAQADLAADRAAESNLTNAITEAKALYQVTQSYSAPTGQPYGPRDFSMQAPEFNWITGSCRAATANCISLQVLDVGSDGDTQGVALAAYSPASSTCWYAIDIEATPAVIQNDPTAFLSTSHSANAGISAGVFYARSPVGSTPTSCAASLVLHPHQAHWGASYTNAGGLS
jgi:hypothetical protein